MFVVCCDLAPPRQEPSLISDQYLQFTLEDARERLSSLGQSPDRNLRSRLEAGPGVREQRHSVHVVTSSPSSTVDKGKSVGYAKLRLGTMRIFMELRHCS